MTRIKYASSKCHACGHAPADGIRERWLEQHPTDQELNTIVMQQWLLIALVALLLAKVWG